MENSTRLIIYGERMIELTTDEFDWGMSQSLGFIHLPNGEKIKLSNVEFV